MYFLKLEEVIILQSCRCRACCVSCGSLWFTGGLDLGTSRPVELQLKYSSGLMTIVCIHVYLYRELDLNSEVVLSQVCSRFIAVDCTSPGLNETDHDFVSTVIRSSLNTADL